MKERKPMSLAKIAERDLGVDRETAERISRAIHARRLQRAAEARERARREQA